MNILYTTSVGLFVNGGNGMTDIKIADLGKPRSFLAWCFVNMIDSKGTFDIDNAVAIEISSVDLKHFSWIWGRRWGTKGNMGNLGWGAITDFGQYITFRLRAFHPEDIEAAGTGVVIVFDD